MSKFTKGEWRIEKREGHSNGVRPVITAMNVDRIAIISYRGVPSIEEADANAMLIAAAPDLLAACKAQEEADNWFGASDTGQKLKDKAKELRVAAIAKVGAKTE